MTSSRGSTWSAAASSWLLGGERGTGECVFLVYLFTQRQAEQPLVFRLFYARRCATTGAGELESLFMRQSAVAFERISCFSCSPCSHLKICMSSWLCILAVARPVFGCCKRSTELDHSRLLVRNACLDSEYMFCIST